MTETETKPQYEIVQRRSKIDIIDTGGLVYSHINSFKTKRQLKDIARTLKHVFPEIAFKIMTKRDAKGQPLGYSLYANIQNFHTIPYSVCFTWCFTRGSESCQKCRHHQKCIQLYEKNEKGDA